MVCSKPELTNLAKAAFNENKHTANTAKEEKQQFRPQ